MSSIQKVIKYLAIAFAICLIVSIFMGLYQAVGVLGNLVTDGPSGDGLKIQDYSDSSNILSIDLAASRLKIVEGETLKVETKNKDITSKQENNKLVITEKSHDIFKTKAKEEVVVTVPEGMIFDKVFISTGAGKIDIKNIEAKDLELELGAGKIEIDKITTYHETDIEGGAGKVTIQDAKLNNLNLDAGVGKFSLNAVLSGKTEIDAGVGELNINLLDSKENYAIDAETGIGSMKIDGNSVKGETTYGVGKNRIEIDGGVGSIDIRFVEE